MTEETVQVPIRPELLKPLRAAGYVVHDGKLYDPGEYDFTLAQDQNCHIPFARLTPDHVQIVYDDDPNDIGDLEHRAEVADTLRSKSIPVREVLHLREPDTSENYRGQAKWRIPRAIERLSGLLERIDDFESA